MSVYKFLKEEPTEEEPKKWQISLYEILFGNKDIPVTTEVNTTPDTMITIIGAAAILAAGAVLTAMILRR